MLRLLAAILILLLPSFSHAQGVLQRVRSSTNRPAPWPPLPPRASQPATNSSNPWYADPDGTVDPDGVGTLLVLAGVAATSPLWGPNLLFDEGGALFPSYPFANDRGDYMWVGQKYVDDYEVGEPDFNLKPWSVRISLEDGNDFGNLNRLTGRLFLDGPKRIGFMANLDYFRENLGAGRSDETVLSDWNVTLRFVQSGQLLMHAGIGLRHQLDRCDDQVGFNFLYRADWFITRPLHLESYFALGNLNEALVINGRIALGANFRNLEFFTGYDFLRIGNANLQGPFLGLRCWF